MASRRAEADMPASLDDFIAQPFVRERHEAVVGAPADLVFQTACDFDMNSIPLVRAIFRMRAFVLRATPPRRTPKGFVAETNELGWGTLEEVPGRLHMTETRAEPTDRESLRKFRRYWRFAGMGVVLIRLLMLPAIRREAEQRWRDRPRASRGLADSRS